MGSAQGLLADLTEPQRGLGWALLSLAYHCWYCPPPCPLPAGTGPSHVLVYQAGLEELRERAAQQDKHSNLLQNILGQMVSGESPGRGAGSGRPRHRCSEALSAQPLQPPCRLGDRMALGVLAGFGVTVPNPGLSSCSRADFSSGHRQRCDGNWAPSPGKPMCCARSAGCPLARFVHAPGCQALCQGLSLRLWHGTGLFSFPKTSGLFHFSFPAGSPALRPPRSQPRRHSAG